MKQSQAMSRLKSMVAHDQTPELNQEELDDLLLRARSVDADGNTIQDVTEWEADTAYELGHMVVVGDFTYAVVGAGVSGAVFNPIEDLTDGTVSWQIVGRKKWSPTYDLNYAAMLGWELKAAKAASMISFTADGARFDREQYISHCQTLATSYSHKVLTTLSFRKE